MAACQFHSEYDNNIDNKNASELADLHVAVKKDDLEKVKYLLELGSDVSKRTRAQFVNDVEILCNCRSEKYCFHKSDEFGNEMKDGDVVAQNALHLAAKHGSVELVELILPFIKNVNEVAEDNSTALHYATQNHAENNRDVRIAQLLLKHGADLEARNSDGKTPLYLAVKLEKRDLVHYLLREGADPNAATLKLSTPLYSALMNDDGWLTATLLLYGASVNGKRNNHEEEPLFYSLRVLGKGYYRFRMVYLLLEAGANSSITNEQGSTALHVAVQENDALLVLLLLEGNCPLGVKDRFDMSPLAVAVCTNRAEIACLLLMHGAPTDDFVGHTSILQHAIMRRNEGMVQLLLKHGADPNFGSGRNKPIVATLFHKNTRIVEMLVAAGADVNCKDKNGRTPLMAAVRKPNVAMMEYLLNHGANLNDSDNRGNTAFHILFENNSYHKEDVIRDFFDAGANLNVENADGLTPFSCMLMSSFTEKEVLAFLEHIALLLACGEHVSPKITRYVENMPKWSLKYKYIACCQELEKMKTTKILGEYTYFQLISLNYNQLICLFQEKDIFQIFEVKIHNFPIYLESLSKHFYSKYKRFGLTKQATHVLSAIFRSQLPPEIIERIVEFMSNESIMKLL